MKIRISHSGSEATKIMVCRILTFMWPFGPLVPASLVNKEGIWTLWEPPTFGPGNGNTCEAQKAESNYLYSIYQAES